jgi:hypothetical protein
VLFSHLGGISAAPGIRVRNRTALGVVFVTAMEFPVSRPFVSFVSFVSLVLSVSFVSLARAQTPFPPATSVPAEARPDFSGTWALDRSISTDLEKASFLPPNRSSQGGGGGGGFGGFRGGRGGFGGGSRSRNQDSSSDMTSDEKTRLSVLTDLMKKGFATLVISHHDPSFVVNDSLDRTQFFQTTGSTDEHDLVSTKVSSTTHWEDSRLVTEYDLSSSRKLMYTYALLPATRQMVLRVRLEANGSQRPTGPEVKLVYTQAAPRSH